MKTTKSDLFRCFSKKPVLCLCMRILRRPTAFVIACTYLCLCIILSVLLVLSECSAMTVLVTHAVLLQGSMPDENSGLATRD